MYLMKKVNDGPVPVFNFIPSHIPACISLFTIGCYLVYNVPDSATSQAKCIIILLLHLHFDDFPFNKRAILKSDELIQYPQAYKTLGFLPKHPKLISIDDMINQSLNVVINEIGKCVKKCPLVFRWQR